MTSRRNARRATFETICLRTSLFRHRRRGIAHEQPATTRRVVHLAELEGAGDRHRVERDLHARMPIHVEVREARLTLGLLQREGLSREGDRHFARTGANTDAELEVLVHGLVRVVRAGLIPIGLHRERLRQASVDTELDLLRLGESFDVLVPIARQANLKLVDRMLRERVSEDRAATSSERQPFEVILLREIRGQHDDVTRRRRERAADRGPAHFLRRREIPLEQRRRQLAVAHVVEPVTRIVFGQQRRHVNVERKDVADGVLILDAAQTPEGVGPSRIRTSARGAVERALEMRGECVVGGVIGSGHPDGRHHAPADLADDLLPHRGV